MQEVARKLEEEFSDSIDVKEVARYVADAMTRFDDAKIDAYLPMFVARRARRELRAAASRPANG
jgi:hypothetical protein